MLCPGSFHFSHIADYIYDFCPLPDPDVGQFLSLALSLYDMLSRLLSSLVCAAAHFFCACLVSVQVSDHMS